MHLVVWYHWLVQVVTGYEMGFRCQRCCEQGHVWETLWMDCQQNQPASGPQGSVQCGSQGNWWVSGYPSVCSCLSWFHFNISMFWYFCTFSCLFYDFLKNKCLNDMKIVLYEQFLYHRYSGHFWIWTLWEKQLWTSMHKSSKWTATIFL